MASRPCAREAETLRAAWGPGDHLSPDAELAAHLDECRTCAEIAALAQAFRDDRDAALAAAHPPSAGVVWWRAQRRAREEASRQAARPIALVHGVALGCAAAAAVAVLGLVAGGVPQNLAALRDAFLWSAAPTASAAGALAGMPYGAVLVLAAPLLLAPVAIYLALSEK